MKKTKKIISGALAAILVMCLMTVSAFAASEPSPNDAKNAAALLPALIILAVAFVIEIIEIYFLASENKRLRISAIPAFAVLALSAQTSFWIVIVLLAADILMGAYIAYLSASLYSKRSKKNAAPAPKPEPEPIPEPEPEPEPEPKPEPKPLPKMEHEQVEHVTVDEANEMMSDEEAISLEIAEADIAEGDSIHEQYSGIKKAEINIDTIGENFEAGDTVTLNSLKEKGLVSKSAGYVKVLARGELDKPLTIVAQGYSVAAVKMILLVGGRVIVADPSPEYTANK